MRLNQFTQLFLSLGIATVLCSVTLAVPYASFVYETTTPDTWEFVLNDTADDVTILRDGGNALNLGALTKGRYTFDMTGFTGFDIQVSKNEATNWRPIAVDIDPIPSPNTNAFRRFEQGSDVLVQTDPTHPLFGAIYVNNDRTNAAAGTNGRPMGDGIYALTGDLIGVDLPTRAALTDPTDTSAAKAGANWQLGDQTVCASAGNCQTFFGTVSGWRMAFDEAGNIIMGDWSDANGGMKWINPDLTNGDIVLTFQDGVVIVDQDGSAGPIPPERIGLIPNGAGEEVHGSIVSRPYVTGTVGNNLTVYGIDEDYDLDGNTFDTAGNTGNHLWKWNVGSTTTGHDQPPELVINGANIPQTSEGTPRDNWLALNVGVLANAVYSPEHDKWYLSQNRADGNQAGLIVVTADGTDGNSPTLEWSSLQWSVDNGLDGHTTVAGNQDVFRSMGGGMELSEDGTKLYLHRVNHSTVNPVLGTTSDVPGAVLIIPLDENGIPDLTVVAGQITNVDSITTVNNASNASRRGLTVDAAGNFYTTNNASELLEVFTPAGNFLAVTSYDGTQMSFDVSTLAAPSADYNEDGFVDAADYILWRKDPASFGGDPGGYDAWRQSFGQTSPGAGGEGSVPEPAAMMLVAIGMLLCGGLRRRQA